MSFLDLETLELRSAGKLKISSKGEVSGVPTYDIREFGAIVQSGVTVGGVTLSGEVITNGSVALAAAIAAVRPGSKIVWNLPVILASPISITKWVSLEAGLNAPFILNVGSSNPGIVMGTLGSGFYKDSLWRFAVVGALNSAQDAVRLNAPVNCHIDLTVRAAVARHGVLTSGMLESEYIQNTQVNTAMFDAFPTGIPRESSAYMRMDRRTDVNGSDVGINLSDIYVGISGGKHGLIIEDHTQSQKVNGVPTGNTDPSGARSQGNSKVGGVIQGLFHPNSPPWPGFFQTEAGYPFYAEGCVSLDVSNLHVEKVTRPITLKRCLEPNLSHIIAIGDYREHVTGTPWHFDSPQAIAGGTLLLDDCDNAEWHSIHADSWNGMTSRRSMVNGGSYALNGFGTLQFPEDTVTLQRPRRGDGQPDTQAVGLVLTENSPLLTQQAGVINAKDSSIGMVGDGVTDDFPAWRKLVAEVNARQGNCTVIIPPGTYYFDDFIPLNSNVTQKGYYPWPIFNDCKNFQINGRGAKFVMRPVTAHSIGTGLSGLMFNNCEDFAVEGINLNGQGHLLTGQNGERFCYGVVTWGCKRYRFLDVTSNHFTTDGFCLGHPVNMAYQYPALDQDGYMGHCVSMYNGRQALSLTGNRRFHAFRCILSQTGRQTPAVAPAYGIDIEPEAIWQGDVVGGTLLRGDISGDITIEECTIDNNVGAIIGAAYPNVTDRVRIINCRGSAGTSTGDAQIIMAVQDGVIEGGVFDVGPHALYPSWGYPNTRTVIRDTEIRGRGAGILSVDNVQVSLQRVRLIGTHTAPLATYFPYIINNQAEIVDSEIFLPAAAYKASGTGLDIKSLLRTRSSRRNRFTTSLTTPGNWFAVDYLPNQEIEEDRYLADLGFIRPFGYDTVGGRVSAGPRSIAGMRFGVTGLPQYLFWNPNGIPAGAYVHTGPNDIAFAGAKVGDMPEILQYTGGDPAAVRFWASVPADGLVRLHAKNEGTAHSWAAGNFLVTIIR